MGFRGRLEGPEHLDYQGPLVGPEDWAPRDLQERLELLDSQVHLEGPAYQEGLDPQVLLVRTVCPDRLDSLDLKEQQVRTDSGARKFSNVFTEHYGAIN